MGLVSLYIDRIFQGKFSPPSNVLFFCYIILLVPTHLKNFINHHNRSILIYSSPVSMFFAPKIFGIGVHKPYVEIFVKSRRNFAFYDQFYC